MLSVYTPAKEAMALLLVKNLEVTPQLTMMVLEQLAKHPGEAYALSTILYFPGIVNV